MPRSPIFAVGAFLCLATVSQDQPTLRVYGRTFIIRDGSNVARVPFAEVSTTPSRHALYRKDANFAVWDSRGLTIRKGKRASTTRLPEISLTPKLFQPDEIAATKKLLKKRVRSKNVDVLSGSMRIGNKVYLLLRWDQKDRTPWLEALVSVDLASKDLHARLLGRFEGFSISDPKPEEALFGDAGSIMVLTRRADKTWGVARYDPAAEAFSFKPVGRNLIAAWRLGPRTLLVEEHSPFNSKTIARVDAENGARRVTYEFQGSAEAVSLENPLVMRFSTPDGDLLRNLDTGAVLRVAKADEAKAVQKLAVVWPRKEPDAAVLYSVDRWNRLATVDQN